MNGLVITLFNGLTLSDLYEMTSQILSHAHTGKTAEKPGNNRQFGSVLQYLKSH